MVKEDISKEIKKCIELNEIENTSQKHFLNITKAVVRGKFIALKAYIEQKKDLEDSTNHISTLKKKEKME